MPKRSNDFQKLVRMVQQAFAPAGAKVTESALVEHQGHAREIDVLIDSLVGMYNIKIAVEAKDHSRPLGPQQIEEYIGKYRQGDGIKVNQVVVVSASGFTRAARDKGRAAGIVLLTLKEASHADWRKFIPPGTTSSLNFAMQPHVHEIAFDPPLPITMKAAMATGSVTCDCCGKSNGSFRDFVGKMVTRFLNDPAAIQKVKANIGNHRGNMMAHAKFCAHKKTLHLGDETYPLSHVTASIHFVDAAAPMSLSLYEQTDLEGNSRVVQQAVASVAGKRFRLLMPDGIQSRQIILDISDENSCGAGK